MHHISGSRKAMPYFPKDSGQRRLRTLTTTVNYFNGILKTSVHHNRWKMSVQLLGRFAHFSFWIKHFLMIKFFASVSMEVRGQSPINEILAVKMICGCAQGHDKRTDFSYPKEWSSSLRGPNLNLPLLEAVVFLSDNSTCGEADITPPPHPPNLLPLQNS